jgi:hypothetical protein
MTNFLVAVAKTKKRKNWQLSKRWLLSPFYGTDATLFKAGWRRAS